MAERTCSFPDCGKPHKARGWCAAHYIQWRRTGEVKPATWAPAGGDCVVCGEPVPPDSGRRKHCSAGCQVADSRMRGQRPKTLSCDFCGQTFSTGRSRTGRLQRIDTKWCPDCGRSSPEVLRFRRYGVTKAQYEAALKDGCTICRKIVPTLRVDHDHACCPEVKGSRLAQLCGNCIRGFLCGPCNRGLGLFGDDPAALRRAAQYLSGELML